MPRYAFRAVNADGVFSRGRRAAANENELFFQLRAQGLNLVDCRAEGAAVFSPHRASLPLEEQALFFRHVLALVQAGVPVHVALEDIAASLPPRLRDVALALQAMLLSGLPLSAAFEKATPRFDALVPLLLQGGEKTGKLPQALRFLEETLRWKHETGEALRRQLSYPLVQIFLSSFAIAVLMTVAVPQIIQLLALGGQGLPAYAAVLLFLMHVVGYGLVAAAVFSALAFLFWPLRRVLGDGGVRFCDRLLLHLPVVGPLARKLALARLTHVFAALLGSGVGAAEALAILPGTEPNRALSAQLGDIAAMVNMGRPLSQAFGQKSLVPPYVIRLLRVGEDGGKLPETLEFVSSLYQREAREGITHLIKIISLFITVGVGLSLIFMVGGALVPLYRGLGAISG